MIPNKLKRATSALNGLLAEGFTVSQNRISMPSDPSLPIRLTSAEQKASSTSYSLLA